MIERIMDDLAAELGMDPIELRRKNWITHEEFPFTTVAGLDVRLRQLRGGDRQGAASCSATTSCGRAGGAPRARATRCSSASASRRTPRCAGWRRRRWLGETGYVAGGWERATVRMLPIGKVEVVAGTSPHGQGHVTTFSQIAADALGVPFDDVEVIHGDTADRAVGPGHVRLPLARRRRHRDPQGGGGGGREGQAARRPPARGRPRRHRVRRRHLPGQGHAGRRPRPSRSSAFAAFAAHYHAGRQSSRSCPPTPHRPGDLLLPARHPPVRGRGRHRDRDGEDPHVRLRRRRRQGGEPA